MLSVFKKATLGLALGATALVATAAPAEAQRWRGGWGRGYYHHHDRTGPAIAAGVLGLAVGAAIASGNRDRYYDRPYYDRGYYPRDYYYEDDYYYRYRPRCYTEWRYDPYWGDRERIRICR